MSANPRNQGLCLHEFVRCVVQQYLADMGQTAPDNLHEVVISEAERSLIETVLSHTDGNQSRAAEMLGITRTTLRSRVKRYGLDG